MSAIPVVELLTSELVANAVAYGSGPTIELRLSCDGRHLIVEVTDDGDALPVVRETGPEVVGGQGMRLVDRLAESWGVERSAGGGKTVWFRLAVAGAGADTGAGTTSARYR